MERLYSQNVFIHPFGRGGWVLVFINAALVRLSTIALSDSANNFAAAAGSNPRSREILPSAGG